MLFKDVIGQEEAKQRLIAEVKEGRIPHAQLICGPEGTGKLPLAIAYARYICCENRGEQDACGICPTCVKFNKLVHPDVHFVFPIVKKGKKEVYALALSNEIVENIASYYDKDKFMTINICDRNKIHHYDQTVNITEFLENINEIIHVSVSFINNEFVEEYLKIFTKKFPMLKVEIMQDSFGEVKWLEIAQKGVEKYKGIAEVAKLEGILNENIIAFGDGLNDVDMLKKCGVGVAMKNALPEVKEQADYITSRTNNENGVVEFLKEYLVEI